MNKLNLFAVLASSAVAVSFAACSSSSSSNNPGGSDSGADQTSSGSDTGTGGDTETPMDSSPGNETASDSPVDSPMEAGPPAPPTLGTQIDRMGRPAINTALNHTFDTTAAKGPAKDAYNADNNPANWSTNVPQFKANLAILDSLDTVCGNQAGYGALLFPDYTALATVLSADALWLNTGSTVCSQYLGLELNALGVANTDCGGRTLSENTIDVTYNLAAGTETLTDAGVGGPATNGITAPQSPPSATFPYLATPY